jgi:SOS-response transcriptional repressor LexA
MVKKKIDIMENKIDTEEGRSKFCDKLRVVMRSKGWNQKKLAEITGVTERTVSRWMRDGIKPGDTTLWKITHASGYNFKYLRDDGYEGPLLESARWAHEARTTPVSYQELSAIYSRIEEILSACGWSKEKLTAKAGLTCKIRPQSDYWIGENESVPSPWNIEKIADTTGYSKDWIWCGKGDRLQKDDKSHPKINTQGNITEGPRVTRSVPLISFVQAGDWTEAVEEFSPEDAEEFLPVTSSVGPRTFGLRVVGNSMEPEFWAGEIVIVDPDRDAETGSFVVAKINHDEATFKQLIKDGGSVFLRPLNNAYPVMDVTGRDLRIVGRVVEKVKRY